MEPTCVQCKKPYRQRLAHQKFCSPACSRDYWRYCSGRDGNGALPGGTVSAISELKTATYFLALGYSVFHSMSLTSFWDLIAIKGDETLKIKVRTGYKARESGALMFPRKAPGMPDVFAVYVHRLDQLFIVPAAEKDVAGDRDVRPAAGSSERPSYPQNDI